MEIETNHERGITKVQYQLQRITPAHVMKVQTWTGDHGGYAQQAKTIKAGKLVLKVSRYHVADLTEGISHLIFWENNLIA